MKKIKLIAIVLSVVLTMVGCKGKEEANKSEEETKSAIESDYIHLTMVRPTTINPIMNKDKSVGYITNLIYDGLFTIDENYNTVPQLVEEYGISQDGTSIHIKLKDATWHDGSEITSKDVDFTINLIQNNPDSPYSLFTQNISNVSVINNKEFNIKFKEKDAFSVDTLIFPIVSQKQLSLSNGAGNLEYKNNLIGNGPYKIVKYQEREGMMLDVNENYYDEIPENAKNVQVSMVPDEESQVSLVMSLQSDIANISLNDLSKFQEKEFNITKYEGRDFEYVLFNFDNVFLRDVNFRKAIAHSINKDTILEEGYMGDATLVNFPLNSKSKYYDKELKQLSYDKEKAKSYLEKVKPISEEMLKSELEKEASLNDSSEENGNNVEENNNLNQNSGLNNTDEGKDEEKNQNKEKTPEEIKKMISQLNLKIIVNKDNSERKKSAYVISENLKAIGIKSTIVEMNLEEINKALDEKSYDLALVGWELSSVPNAIPIIQNSGLYDEKLNAYIESLKNATTEKQIAEIYKSIQNYVVDNAIFISLVIREDYIVANRRLNGKIQPNDFDVYEGISNLNIKNK